MMTQPAFMKHPIRQVAYYVPDARAAALQHAAAFGSGPFFVADHIPLTLARYRGKPGVFDHTSAYGQWGDVMLELVQVNSKEPSVFTAVPQRGPWISSHCADRRQPRGVYAAVRKGRIRRGLLRRGHAGGRIRDDGCDQTVWSLHRALRAKPAAVGRLSSCQECLPGL